MYVPICHCLYSISLFSLLNLFTLKISFLDKNKRIVFDMHIKTVFVFQILIFSFLRNRATLSFCFYRFFFFFEKFSAFTMGSKNNSKKNYQMDPMNTSNLRSILIFRQSQGSSKKIMQDLLVI